MTGPGGHADLLLPAIVAAKKAGDAILDIYAAAFTVEQKDDRSPLTAADKRSHEVIIAALASMPGRSYPVLSEEGKDIPYERRKEWRVFWLVDPLDGTKEFIGRNGEFTVNIALVERERPVLGVIYVPVSEVCFFAAKGLGAYKLQITHASDELKDIPGLLERSQPLHASSDGPFSVVASRSHPS
jgi:3'(2'), 5'-bisphosphate nucleotidase